VGPIDFFIHDSLHTFRNILFELNAAWKALNPGGVVVADDIEETDAFVEFCRTALPLAVIVLRHADKDGLMGVAMKGR
jgi:hypothetical protein